MNSMQREVFVNFPIAIGFVFILKNEFSFIQGKSNQKQLVMMKI